MSWLRILGLTVGVLVAAGAVFEVLTRRTAHFDVPPLAVPPGTRTLVVLFHGREGRDEPTFVALDRRMRELAAGAPATALVRYIWSPWSDRRFRSRENGMHVGEVLGRQAAAMEGLELIHLVSHSAGAFPLEAFCRAYRKAARRPAHLAVTMLDPMGVAGLYDFGWGARNYGTCADYAEAVINTDDPVPGTNTPLRHAWNLDVTAARPASYQGGGHRWPVQYYLDRVTAADIDASAYSHRDRQRGAVAKPD